MGKIVIVGSINRDYSALVNELPVTGETRLAHGFKMSGGGKGANQAMAAAVFSDEVTMIAKLGDDIAGHDLYEKMKESGIDVSCIEFSETATGRALIYVDERGKNSIVVYPGANRELDIDMIERHRKVIEAASIVLVQLEVPMDTVEYVAEVAHQANVPFLLNPAPARPLRDDLLSKVTYITPNETELLRLTQSYDAQKGSVILRNKGVKNVIVTLGDRGSYFRTETEEGRIPSFKVNAIDTTAAGDSFSGALAAKLAEGMSLHEALVVANATGALTATKVGAQEALPTAEEVEALIKGER